MSLHEVLFWFLSAMAIGCAMGVILSRNPVKSVLFLIATFFAISGHYVLMNAQFLAVVNIIVYAGAIMVLFLFVVMLMNLNAETEPVKNYRLRFIGIISGGCLLLILLSGLMKMENSKDIVMKVGESGLIEKLGSTLFTSFVLPFEISSILFLSAMIGAVIIGKKN